MREPGAGSGPDAIVKAFRNAFPDDQPAVVSNRKAYAHRLGEDVGGIRVKRPAWGMTSALDPLLRAAGSAWIAWGSGDADAAMVHEDDRVRVPPESPRSSDVGTFAAVATMPEATQGVGRIRNRSGPVGGQSASGVDRMDDSKGVPEKPDHDWMRAGFGERGGAALPRELVIELPDD